MFTSHANPFAYRNDSEVQRAGDAIIIARHFEGLWKQLPGSKAVRISGEGGYSGPLVTPDGKWVIISKTDDDWSKPAYIVRFNLRTGREFRVNLEPADEFETIAFLASHNKTLLRRAKTDESLSLRKGTGPDRPEYYLLDAATGETRLVSGEFFAGVFARYVKDQGVLEEGDIEEALRAASAIGDDQIQKQTTGYVVPDSFTHGTSEQRLRWFRRGYESGDTPRATLLMPPTFSAADRWS